MDGKVDAPAVSGPADRLSPRPVEQQGRRTACRCSGTATTRRCSCWDPKIPELSRLSPTSPCCNNLIGMLGARQWSSSTSASSSAAHWSSSRPTSNFRPQSLAIQLSKLRISPRVRRDAPSPLALVTFLDAPAVHAGAAHLPGGVRRCTVSFLMIVVVLRLDP